MVFGFDVDAETEITVPAADRRIIAAMMATVDAGEEVVVFEPFMKTTRLMRFCLTQNRDTFTAGDKRRLEF